MLTFWWEMRMCSTANGLLMCSTVNGLLMCSTANSLLVTVLQQTEPLP